MSIVQEIEAEVQSKADSMSIEVLFMLVDKLERDFKIKTHLGKVTAREALDHYVRMKIMLHHMKRKYDEGYHWIHDGRNPVSELPLSNLINKTKKARRDYYVAKRRVEGEHVAGCSCRGCRCLAEIPWDRANEACSDTD